MAMAHPRKLIRKAVVALLVAANTNAGARVTATRVEPHRKSQLPAISVYTLREPIDQDASSATSPRELKRNVRLEVTGWVAHSDTISVDDAMDDLAEQIEAAMDADPYLGGTAGEFLLEETVMQVVEDDAASDPLVGVVNLTYVVTYHTMPAEPVLDDFLTVGATHEIEGGVADTRPAVETFTVQEAPP